jgi:hypothetical protein
VRREPLPWLSKPQERQKPNESLKYMHHTSFINFTRVRGSPEMTST